jgi:hypothetical protein
MEIILTRGTATPQAACAGCGCREPICPGCGICRDCRDTDAKHGTRAAQPCIVCDRGQPDITRLAWHTRGRWPLGLRARGAA